MLNRLLSILSWIGAVVIFAAVAVRLLKPEWDRYAVYAAWTGLVLIVLYMLGQGPQILASLKTRNTRYGLASAVGILAALGVLIGVNYLSVRRGTRWDLTANRQHSLSSQTTTLLATLDAPVKLLVFDQKDRLAVARTRLNTYRDQSPHVQVEYIDADARPLDVKQHNVTDYGTIVIEYKGRHEQVRQSDEQSIVNGLLKVINPQHKKVYFLSGHGERGPADGENNGYTGAAAALKRDNYDVETIALAQARAIPADTTAIVVAGPKADITADERVLLEEYLAKGGKLFLLIDPPDDLKQPVVFPQLVMLARTWGIDVTSALVVDASGRAASWAAVVAAPPYPAHPIVERFELFTAFPLARALAPVKDGAADRTARPFIQSARESWAETDYAQLGAGKPTLDTDKGDTAGPISIGLTVATPLAQTTPPAETSAQAPSPTETRVAVLGDSDFASNRYLGTQGNSDLFMNTVNWLAQQESQITVRAHAPADRRIAMTRPQVYSVVGIVLGLPVLLFGVGLYALARRNR